MKVLFKAGYKNICEIGKERIRRAGIKIQEEFGETAKDLDIGFRVLKLDSSNMRDVFYAPSETERELLKQDNVKEDRNSEDLLFQVMLSKGIELSSKIEVLNINNKQVYSVNHNYLVACFEDILDDETITQIAKMQPNYFVMKDSSAATDAVLDNFDQIFKTYSKETDREVI